MSLNLRSTGILEANWPATPDWPALRTFTAKRRAWRTTGRVRASLSKHTSSSSGSSDREHSALVVIPNAPSALCAVTTATPVVKWPMTAR